MIYKLKKVGSHRIIRNLIICHHTNLKEFTWIGLKIKMISFLVCYLMHQVLKYNRNLKFHKNRLQKLKEYLKNKKWNKKYKNYSQVIKQTINNQRK